MQPEIKASILDIIKKIIKAIRSKNSQYLKKISNYTIHNASIYQEGDSVTIAVLNYSLAKIIERNLNQETKETTKTYIEIINKLKKARYQLKNDKTKEFRDTIKSIFSIIKKIDDKLSLYIEEIIEKARIKKGSIIYEHGISLARTSEILGISQWELIDYIGKTRIPDIEAGITDVKKRIGFAKQIFNIR